MDKTMMDEQVIRIIATRGPVLPVLIAKETGSNTMLAGAVLSKLASDRKIFISNTKIGGSPVYYLKDQAYRLQELYKYLNEKDKRTFDLLKGGKIIRDIEQDALTRVSLRSIKDFAVPLEVTLGDQKEIFWKWYMVSNEEATQLIRDYLKVQENERPARKEESAEMPEREIRKEHEKPLTNFVRQEARNEEAQPQRREMQQEKPAKKLKTEETEKIEADFTPSDSFSGEIIRFLKEKGITIKNIEVKKKNSDIDLILNVPSIVGNIEYYCKAKNKPKINDADLSSAYIQGQAKKLPSMLITSGELTKKAYQMLGKEIRVNVLKL